MSVYEPFTIRQLKQEGNYPDFYSYDEIPPVLRNKLVILLRNSKRDPSQLVDFIGISLGLFDDSDYQYYRRNPSQGFDKILRILQETRNANVFIEILEVILCHMQMVSETVENRYAKIKFIDTINKINKLFDLYMIGYQYIYETKKIYKRDSEFTHNEVVLPMLKLLHDLEFKGAEQEFLVAYEHYTKEKNKDAIVNAGKSLESTLITIFKNLSWSFDERDVSHKLIEKAFNNNLIPPEMKSQFTALRSTIESSVPPIRNKKGAHGQGKSPIDVPDHLAAFVLHQTAACILFLVESYKALKTETINE